MSLTTTTHLNLPGTAAAALAFYGEVFDGRVDLVRYRDAGMPADAPGAELVLFGQVESPSGFRIMAYDVPGGGDALLAGATHRRDGVTTTERPFFVSVRGSSVDEIAQCWERLAADAVVIEAFAASAWSAGSGMLTDRFGVTWVLDVAASAG